jgi:allophanate hydrolase
LFEEASARIESLGGSLIEIDFAPFLDAAQLLYGGPWIAERYAAFEEFIKLHASAMHPTTRQIIEAGRSPTAADAFRGQYQLLALKRASEKVWDQVDVLLTPTAGTIYEIAQINAQPIQLNTTLGYYTNSMNLLDLAGVAIPAGFRNDGLPFGITIIARSATDHSLLALAGRLHRALASKLGAVELAMPPPVESPPVVAPGFLPVAVCGAHMGGLPLNWQLRDRGGYLVRTTRTADKYRFFALPGGPPERPGLVRLANGGASVEVEVWAIRAAEFGSFVAGIPAPLGIGTIELQDGAKVPGFLCESYATDAAVDITRFGGWRGYLKR